MNTWKRRALALLSVPLLALPSAAGVYLWLEPHINWLFAGLTAAGFELLYIGINVLIITTPELRRYARNVALAGVVTAIIFNTLARYQTMVGGDLRAVAIDGVALGLAVIESIPLAGLAYAMSVLLHRLSESQAAPTRPIVAHYRARLARRLWKLRSEARSALAIRAGEAATHAMLAQARADVESARAELRRQGEEFAQLLIDTGHVRAEMDAARAEQIQAHHAAAQHHAEFLRVSREQETDRREYAQVAAQLREELQIARAAASLDVLAVARRMVGASVPLREIAPLIGLAESTLRGRLKAASNGHVVDA
jgi:hypothetical protein